MVAKVEEIVGAESPGDIRVKPALRTLMIDQDQLLDPSTGSGNVDLEYGLRDGFPDRRTFIEWYQSAVVRTIGNIADDWDPVDCIDDETLVAAVIREPGQGVYPMQDPEATTFRRWVESEVVLPACTRAFRTIREEAVEYIKSGDGDDNEWASRDLDPSSQSNVAMRPGFQTLDEQQTQALRDLWSGFKTEDELAEWLHSLDAPSNGEVPDDFASRVMADGTAVDYLVHDRKSENAGVYRETVAVTHILPAFIDGVRSMDAGELAKITQDGPTTLRDE